MALAAERMMFMETGAPEIFQQFTVPVAMVIRKCMEEDLPALEWYGMFREHRAIIRRAFKRQLRGESLMLVAEANGFPVGQVWIDFARKSAESCGVLWAFRIIPPLQNRGIGARLLAIAEQVLRERGLAVAEAGVEKCNSDARRFYQRYGYRKAGHELVKVNIHTPEGRPLRIEVDQWIFRKPLGRAASLVEETMAVEGGESERGAQAAGYPVDDR